MRKPLSYLSLLLALAVGSVAGSALAGGTSAGLSSEKSLTFRTGATDQWVLAGATRSPQPVVASNCELNTTSQPLVAVSAKVGSTSAKPGFTGDSLGVFAGGSRGTPCGRVNADETLILTFIYSDTTGIPEAWGGLHISAKLDLELKQNVVILATAKKSTDLYAPSQLFQFNSGLNQSAPAFSGATVSSCSKGADSGSDSGPNDNCTWRFVLPAGYDTLEFSVPPLNNSVQNGNFSIEGGGDFGALAAQNYTEFAWVDGTLACGGTASQTGDYGTDVTVRRLPCGTGAIPYVIFDREPGTGGYTVGSFEFLTPPDAPNQSYVMTVSWPPEAAPAATPPALDLNAVKPTLASFDGDPAEIQVDLCVGDPQFDLSGNVIGLTGTLPDLDPSLPGTQYICELGHTLDYVDENVIELDQILFVQGDLLAGRK
jgi:hypothetical protein